MNLTSPIYLIDCSAIMGFSGADQSDPNKYLVQREHIWTSLEAMIDDGKLKTVPQVLNSNGELQFNDDVSYQRLRTKRDKLVLRPTQGYESRITQILSKYPKLLSGKMDSYTREPADPYLIDVAAESGLIIVTEELLLRDRKGSRRNRKTSIPDVCEAEGVQWRYLNDFYTTRESWSDLRDSWFMRL